MSAFGQIFLYTCFLFVLLLCELIILTIFYQCVFSRHQFLGNLFRSNLFVNPSTSTEKWMKNNILVFLEMIRTVNAKQVLIYKLINNEFKSKNLLSFYYNRQKMWKENILKPIILGNVPGNIHRQFKMYSWMPCQIS